MVRATVALLTVGSAQETGDSDVLPTRWPLTPCAAGNYRCSDGVSCVDLSSFCDGITDCADASDETVCSRLRDAFEEAKPRLRRQGASANPNYAASKSDSSDSRYRRQAFPAFTTASPFFFGDVTTGGFDDFFGFDITTQSLLDGDFFNLATTGFPAFGPALATTADPFGGDLFFNPTTQSPMNLPSFTTESLLNFFGDTVTEDPLFGDLLTTAGLFPGMLQTTEASFIFPPVQTTVPSEFPDLLPATTEETFFEIPTTPATVFLPPQTTQDIFDLNIATTPAPAFPEQTTEGFVFPEVQTTDDPFVFPEQTTAGFQIPTTEGFDLSLLGTTPAGLPDLLFPATTADPFGGIFPATTEGLVFPDFQTTPFPSFTTEGLPLFPDVTTESLVFPSFTTAAPTVDSGDFFTCANGDRVPVDVVCDKIADCLDGSDELNCPDDTTEIPTTIVPTTTEPMIEPTTESSTTVTTSTATTATTTSTGSTIPARAPSGPPPDADEEQYERWFDTFMNWRAAIFNDWLNVMKVYQQRSGIKTDDNSSCSSASLSFCSNGRKTCKDDLDGCQYCFCYGLRYS
ncbi:Oidioi.mRNA.OKI2018_I69.chr2.g5826.t1.cds [Oikopleura dioica]|uniref:Oidioi.mRNA.OKI2018_I69.chr2.g5826.t1.cds n=1 Tax=Oikopleura dioica TaxID=34765 RepID=A0ABN7T1H3_OIKDI|nr:Oidioi.mRNA.OKI2018_I69.chr2.g5826.t1.cds [Oikopleura dioica]